GDPAHPRRRALRPARRRAAVPARSGRRASPRATSRGDPPDAQRRRSRRCATRLLPRTGLARPRATGDAPSLRVVSGPRRLATARTARVRAAPGGQPLAVDGHTVAHVRESWLVAG